jgi:hypothetical protein
MRIRDMQTMASGGALAVPPIGQGFQSREGTLGSWSTEAPDDFDWSGDEDGIFPVSRLRQQYIDYLSAKSLEYEEQKQSRHYRHGAQWTPDEIRRLRERRQPIITFNTSGRQINKIVGLVQRLRQDPKAYPRNPKNAAGAEIATQCVRSVLQGSDWEFLDSFCADQAATEGIAGVELKLIDGDHDDPDVGMDFVFGDDFFYDPRSFKPDFSDARYMGIAKWLDVEAAIELFPDKEQELRTLMVETGFDLTTHADREFKWIYVNEKRLRLVEHWYKHKGKWYWAFYCSMIMLDQGVSPFYDERKRPMNRFIMFSAAVDHDGDRYGFMRDFKGPQDEENQRRSKALYMSNVTRLIGTKGAVDDVERARREYSRPDGYVEVNPGFDPPKPDDKTGDLQAQLALMQDARAWVQGFANVQPDLISRDVPGDHSGVAINLLQRAGLAELGPYLRNYKAWKKRVYRAVWNVVRSTWQAERYIRVTDNQEMAQFIQLNGVEYDDIGRPVFINAIGNISVEMDMDDSPDEASLLQDTYDQIKNDPTIPFLVKLEFMPIGDSKKKRIQQLMQQQPDPQLQQAKNLELQNAQEEINLKRAKTADVEAQSAERHARSITNVARAGHYAHQANLDVSKFVREGMYQAARDQTPDGDPNSGSGGVPPLPRGAPQGVPIGGPPQNYAGAMASMLNAPQQGEGVPPAWMLPQQQRPMPMPGAPVRRTI